MEETTETLQTKWRLKPEQRLYWLSNENGSVSKASVLAVMKTVQFCPYKIFVLHHF